MDIIVQAILKYYQLPLGGIHGISHWARVWENGTRVARESGANIKIVQLFALFHDSQRRNEGHDLDHGLRGAELAKSLRQTLLSDLSHEEFELLYFACANHTDGFTEGDITVQACWDADRLDLNRVGILPLTKRLCTRAAKSAKILLWANERAARREFPEFAVTWTIEQQR